MGFTLVLSHTHTSQQFHANQLILNGRKIIIVRFTPTKLSYYPLHIEYASKLLTKVFLACKLMITLRGCDIELILPKKHATCLAVRRLFYVSNTDALWIVYFAYFHSIIKYNVIFWVNFTNICWVYLLQKRIIRPILGVGSRYCVLANVGNLIPSLFHVHIYIYMHTLMMFVINNLESFQTNSSVYGMNKRNKTHLHRPVTNHSCFQNDVSYSCIKIFKSIY